MPGSEAIQHPRRTAQFQWTSPRAVLAALLLTLLSGLPQIGIGLTAQDFAGEKMTAVPVTRSMLIDKLLPEVASLTPPHLSDFPPALVLPPPLPFRMFDGHAGDWDEPKPSPWLSTLTQRLYRHHSSYV